MEFKIEPNITTQDPNLRRVEEHRCVVGLQVILRRELSFGVRFMQIELAGKEYPASCAKYSRRQLTTQTFCSFLFCFFWRFQLANVSFIALASQWC